MNLLTFNGTDEIFLLMFTSLFAIAGLIMLGVFLLYKAVLWIRQLKNEVKTLFENKGDEDDGGSNGAT